MQAGSLVCRCKCHRGDGVPPADPPALDDFVGTASACSRCRDRHYPPLTYEPPDAGQPPRLYDPTDDTD